LYDAARGSEEFYCQEEVRCKNEFIKSHHYTPVLMDIAKDALRSKVKKINPLD